MSNAAILGVAHQVMRGEGWEPRDKNGRPVAGLCLAQVRWIVETACGLRPYQLYDDYVTDWVQPKGYDRSGGHWARDAERSLRNLRMAVKTPDRLPGDLVFNYEAAKSVKWGVYVGHVGVLLDGDMVLENINPAFRVGVSLMRGTTGVTPLSAWKRVTTVIRFRVRDNVVVEVPEAR